MDFPDIDPLTLQWLQSYHFDAAEFASLRHRLRYAGIQGFNHLSDSLAIAATDLSSLPAQESIAHAALFDRGVTALRRGEVGAIVLAGGMATRFGNVVKGAVEVADHRSFLEIKLNSLWRAAQLLEATLPIEVMVSFLTQDQAQQQIESMSTGIAKQPTQTFCQSVSLRLLPDGELYRDPDGRLSPHTPGHGDLLFALRQQGVLQRFEARGTKYLFVANLDNLAATLDPAIIGFHLEHGQPVTAEVVDRWSGDSGGALLRVGDRPQILESFRIPPSFAVLPATPLNANTFVLSTAALRQPLDLHWYAALKQLDGRDAVQFERVLSEITALLPTRFLRVERGGEASRFIPVKDRQQLEQRRDAVKALLVRRDLW